MKTVSKGIIICLFIILFGSNVSASYIFSDEDKIKIANHTLISISTVGKNLAISETVFKAIATPVSQVLRHVLSRFDDKVVAAFLKYNEAELAEKLNQIIAVYQKNNSLKLAKKYKNATGFFKKNKHDLIFITTDILIEFIKLYTLNNDEAKGLLLDLLYNDLKAYIKLQTGDPLGATIDWSLANSKALYKSTTGIYKLSKEYKELIDHASYTEAYQRVLELLNTYTSFVAKSITSEEKEQRIKGFTATCETDDTINYYVGFNQDIVNDFCSFYRESIVKFDKNKLSYLVHRMTSEDGLYTRKEFKNYLDSYFPEPDISTYLNLYDSINIQEFDRYNEFDSIQPNTVSYSFIKRAMKYGFDVSDFIPYDSISYKPDAEISREQSVGLILLGMYLTGNDININKQKSIIIGNNNYFINMKMTRQDLAYYFNDLLKLEDGLSSNEKNNLRDIETSAWSYEALVLKRFGIVSTNKKDFRGSDNATVFEFLVMLVNSLDYGTCGYTKCSNLDFIKSSTIQLD